MIEVSQVLECKQLHVRGTSLREISRKLGISRNTVRRYLRGDFLEAEVDDRRLGRVKVYLLLVRACFSPPDMP